MKKIDGPIIFVLAVFCFLISYIAATDNGLSFPMVYRWSKRNHESLRGCTDPTEPFQCPGTKICISLQFLCDGHPGDCPNNYDEDQGLCISCESRKNFFFPYPLSTVT